MSSGYNPESYYSEYDIDFSDKWKYSHIVDALDSSNSATFSVINEFGLVKNYIIIVDVRD